MSVWEQDIDAVIHHSHRPREFLLWFRITMEAFLTLQNGHGRRDMARAWIEDPENDFFDFVADCLGYSPAMLRKRMREALERSWAIKKNVKS